MFPNVLLQFDDDKDDGKIEKAGVMSCPGVYPWQTIKTENEGKIVGLCCRRNIFYFFLVILLLVAP